MKIAICYFGLLRSFEDVYDSHKKYIYDILMNHNIQYNIFLHSWKISSNADYYDISGNIFQEKNIIFLYKKNFKIFQIEDQTLFRSKYDTAIFNLKPVNPLTSACYTFEQFERLYQLPPSFFVTWITTNQGKPGMPFMIFEYNNIKYITTDSDTLGYLNMICGLESQRKCVEMALNDDEDYDYFLIIRPDILIYDPIDIDALLSVSKKSITLLNNRQYKGYNDRVAFCSKEQVKFFSHRIRKLKNYREYRFNNIDSYKLSEYDIPEVFLKYCLDSENVNVNEIHFLEFDIIRPHGSNWNK